MRKLLFEACFAMALPLAMQAQNAATVSVCDHTVKIELQDYTYSQGDRITCVTKSIEDLFL